MIVHGCNCQCTMGAGIAKEIKTTFPEAFAADKETAKGNRDKLGTISFATVARDGLESTVVNGYTKINWRGRGVKADYAAIRAVMAQVKQQFGGRKIGYPKIGAGLAKGDWTTIAAIIDEELEGEHHRLVEYSSHRESSMSKPNPTFFPAAADFRAWLEEHHATTDHLWVGYYKKATKKVSVTWEDTVEEALCYGWIDGIRKSRDEESYMIRFTPRKPRSVWSQRNIDLVKRLTAESRMRAEGLAAFAFKDLHPDSGYATSKMDGCLTDQMVARFKETEGAWEFYQEQPPGYRKQAARWVTNAKREETRERRLATLIDDSGNRLRIKQLRKG